MKKHLFRILSCLVVVSMLTGTGIVEENLESEIRESTPAPVSTPAPEPTTEPEPQPTQAVTTELPAVETSAPVEEPSSEPSSEPSTEPASESDPAENVDPIAATVEPAEEATAEPAKTAQDICDEWINELSAKNFGKDFDVVLFLHDKLIASVSRDTSEHAADTADAAFLDGKCGSKGYAAAFAMLCDAADIECRILTDDDDEAWNVVRIENSWYHIDCFNDDTSEHYLFFGLTDDAMHLFRSWKASSAPSCSASEYNFFVYKKSYVPASTDEELLSFAEGMTGSRHVYYCGNGASFPAEEFSALGITFSGSAPYYIFTASSPVEPEAPVLNVSESALSMKTGETRVLTASTEESVTWSSSDETVATVFNGTVTAGKTGSAVITCALTADPSVSAQCAVDVTCDPTAIHAESSTYTLGVGETVSLANWSLSPADATTTVRYSVRSTRYALVNASGTVTGRRVGSTTVTLTTANGKKATVKIIVKKAPASVKMIVPRVTIAVGETLKPSVTLSSKSAGSYSFSDEDGNDTLSIDTDTGLITALQPGSEKVTITTYNGKTYSGTVTVCDAPSSLSFTDETFTIAAGDSRNVRCTFDTDDYPLHNAPSGMITYTSSDPNAIAIDPVSGRVRAIAQSETPVTITAVSYNGHLEASCPVTIVPAPTSITLGIDHIFNPSIHSATLGIGETAQITTSFAPENAVSSLTYTSSRKSVATVNGNGVITAKRAGTATITVKAFNGVKRTIKITVKKAPKSISLRGPRTTMAVGEQMTVTSSITSGSSATSVFADDTENNVLSIDANTGVVTAAAAGTESISVRSYNGKVASQVITVVPAPTQISLAADELRIPERSSYTITYTLSDGSEAYALAKGAAGMVSFSSSNPEIATIDATTGRIYAVKPGDVTITATTFDGAYSDTMALNIAPLPTAFSVSVVPAFNDSAARSTLGIGETAKIITQFEPADAMATLKYSSSYSSIASVDANGVIVAKKAGKTTITVTSSNNIKRTFTVTVKAAPKWVTLIPSRTEIGIGETIDLNTALPAGYAGVCLFSDDEASNVLTVDPRSGLLTANEVGSETVTATTYNGVSASALITVLPAPESISLSETPELFGVGQKYQLSVAYTPADSTSLITYTCEPEGIVSIDSTGMMTATGAGTAVVTAHTYLDDVYDETAVTVMNAPDRVWLDADSIRLEIDDKSYSINAHIPDGSYTVLTYSVVSGHSVTVDEEGHITPQYVGTSVVRVSAHNGVYANLTVTVYDPYMPTGVKMINSYPTALDVGQTYTPEYTVVPETAVKDIVWSSSDTGIATVDPVTGTVTAVSYGRVTIRGIFTRNEALQIVYSFTVLSPDRCLSMPTRRLENASSWSSSTLRSRISVVSSEINAVKQSALREAEDLYLRGIITKSDYSRRCSIINNAFAMYNFPWGTKSLQPYWKAANSEGGLKDFKAGTVYFGMPYTQKNRTYNVSKALSEGRWTGPTNNMYLLNRSKLVNDSYCGNDCSAFASMAIWGLGHSRSGDTTKAIASNSAYKTISSANNLRPGDLLNSYNHHVVMFLYYANASHTQAVIIQQGGSERGINTISASIVDISSYTDDGYKIRRLASLG